MAQKMEKYYQYVEETEGLRGKVELAIRTGVTATMASTTPDAPTLLRKFEVAVFQITGKPAPKFWDHA